jgi:hypothetical protein
MQLSPGAFLTVRAVQEFYVTYGSVGDLLILQCWLLHHTTSTGRLAVDWRHAQRDGYTIWEQTTVTCPLASKHAELSH